MNWSHLEPKNRNPQPHIVTVPPDLDLKGAQVSYVVYIAGLLCPNTHVTFLFNLLAISLFTVNSSLSESGKVSRDDYVADKTVYIS